MTKQLYQYQKDAINLALRHERYLLALDMGLGKTFCAANWLVKVNEQQWNKPLNCVIVCDAIKLDDWANELANIGLKNVVVVNTTKTQNRFLEFSDIEATNYIISYGKLSNAIHKWPDILKTPFNLIIDESQSLKNKSSKRTQRIISRSPFVERLLLLSGDPISTSYANLWPQMKLLHCFVDGFNYWDFERSFCIVELGYGSGGKFRKITGFKNVEHLMRILYKRAYFLKTEQVKELPQKRSINLPVKASQIYRSMEKNGSLIEENFEVLGESIIKQYHALRQLASGVVKADDGSFYQLDNSKVEMVKILIDSSTYNFTLFYNYNSELWHIKESLKDLDIAVFEINGEKNELNDALNCSKRFILLIHYLSGARGVDGLQFKVFNQIYYSPPNSGEMFRQSIKRVHRIGQSRPVTYYFLYCKNSIEEHIYKCLKQQKDYSTELFEQYLNERRNS
ncbi:DEAD/DEAH box helicase [Mycoplasma sp. CSL7475-4]|uniref:SNF2-related protein n=1 Tax=Mycoplasma sp. CSL7475-4 TaxID=2973942 RepID=UPI00216AC5A7|nr:DEAD/DEAH box helicase [Mycoplasma sp. CSL7475-4]MCS4536766.1 DEAD/DEAH box helicase [Mycoplasma sp. CSL7475-4]